MDIETQQPVTTQITQEITPLDSSCVKIVDISGEKVQNIDGEGYLRTPKRWNILASTVWGSRFC